MGFQPLWWDEGYSAYLATESPAHAIALTSVDIHPPLYYLLLQAWFAMAGVGVIQARLLSVLLGVAAVPLVWAIARSLLGRAAALAATLLFAVAPLQVYYAQEVRMYALLTFLALLALWGLLAGRRWLVALASLAALYTHYYAVFLVVALAALVLWMNRGRGWPSVVRRWRAAPAAVALGYLPWVVYAGPRLYRYVSAKLVVEADAPMTPLQFPWRHLAAFSLGHLMPGQSWLAPAALLFFLVALIGVYALRLRKSSETSEVCSGRSLRLLLSWLLVPLGGAFVVNLTAPFTDARIERQLIFAAPPFLMLVGGGIAWLWSARRLLGAVLLAGLVGASLLSLAGFYTIPRYPDEDYRPILELVGARQAPGDHWLAIYPWQIGYPRIYLPDRHPEIVAVSDAWADEPARHAGVAALLEGGRRVWFPAFQIKGRIFEEQLAATLAQTGTPVWDDWFGNTRLWLTGPASVEPARPVDHTFDGGLRLASTAVGAGPVQSGVGVLPAILAFEGATEGLRASVQLAGYGSVWGEWDGPLASTLRLGLLAEPGTPPGDFEARMTVYRAGNGTPVERVEGGVPAGTVVSLGAVRVERPAVALPLAALPVSLDEPVPVGPAIRFVGAAVPTATLHTGDDLPVTLFWQAAERVGRELRVFVQLQDEQGVVRGAADAPPVAGHFPTSQWQAGDLVRDPHVLRVAADAPAGRYRVVGGLYDPVTGQRVATSAERDHLDLGSVAVVARAHQFEPPDVALPVDEPLGVPHVARLVGTTIEWPETPGEVAAGTALPLTLVWQVERTPDTRLRAFVQLLDAGNQVGGLADALPGEAPSTAWLPGEYVSARHEVAVRPEARGRYRLIAGLYDPATGARLKAADGADFVVLGEVAVR
ncbi:MAG TPA: glycosyltransferase family 39 protein [Ardenticatenaceae bacterium]|nr:glycosyltransferase family 39 protein [Ardenticatenaceae bacterium]